MNEKQLRKHLRAELRGRLKTFFQDQGLVYALFAEAPDASLIFEILSEPEFASSSLPDRRKAAQAILGQRDSILKDGADNPVSTIRANIARDRSFAESVASAGVVQIELKESGEGPAWVSLTEYKVIGSLPGAAGFPAGTRLADPPRKSLGHQRLFLRFPSGIEQSFQINLFTTPQELPADVATDIAIFEPPNLPHHIALQEPYVDRYQPTATARALLGRLLYLFAHGYSRSRLASSILKDYRLVRDAAFAEHLRNVVSANLQTLTLARRLLIPLDADAQEERLLLAHARAVTDEIIPAYARQGLITQYDYRRDQRCVMGSITTATGELFEFAVRGQASWIPSFLEQDLLETPAKSFVSSDVKQEGQQALDAALSGPHHQRAARCLAVLRTFHAIGLEDDELARKAAAYYAAARAEDSFRSGSKNPNNQIRYLRLFLQLVFGSGVHRVRVDARYAFEYQRLAQFLRLFGPGSTTQLQRPTEGPLGDSINAMLSYGASRDAVAVYRALADVDDISRDLLEQLLTNIRSVGTGEEVMTIAGLVVDGWLDAISKAAASDDVDGALVLDVWTELGLVPHLRVKLEQDFLDHFDDVAAFLHTTEPTELFRLYQNAIESSDRLRDLARNAVDPQARSSVEEGHNVNDLLRRLRLRVDQKSSRLYGTAALTCSCDTSQLVLNRQNKVHFTIRNVERGVAAEARMTLRASAPHVLDTSAIAIPTVQGMRSVACVALVTARSTDPVTIAATVAYADQTSTNKRCTVQVTLPVVSTDQYVRIPKVYTPGQPCRDPALFVGRRQVLADMASALQGQRGDPLVLLHGKRRIGKTSVLTQLELLCRGGRNPDSSADCDLSSFVTSSYVDLEDVTAGSTRNYVRSKILATLGYSLRGIGCDCGPLPSVELAEEPFALAADAWLMNTVLNLREYEYRALIMLDEFDQLLSERPGDTATYGWLREMILKHGTCLSFVYCGADRLLSMMQRSSERLFGMAGLPIAITPLEAPEARQLAELPIRQYAPDFRWQPEALDRVLELCGGHPYYLHYLCDALLTLCNKECRHEVVSADVSDVLEDIIASMPGIKDEIVTLSAAEKVVLAALADRTAFELPTVYLEEVMSAIKDSGAHLDKSIIADSLRRLVEAYVLTDTPSSHGTQFSFSLPLVREYLRRRGGTREMALTVGLA